MKSTCLLLVAAATAFAAGCASQEATEDRQHFSQAVQALATGASDAGAACLQNWRATACGQQCLGETQPDLANCAAFLDCYRDNLCGPDTCGSNPDAICGVNTVKPAMGMAPKTIADQVYQCLGCSSGSPVTSCAGVADGTPCNDGNVCTPNDSCLGGVCVPGSAVCGTACGSGGVCDDAGATLTTGGYPTPTSFQPVPDNSISAIRVGCGVRALLYHDAATPDSRTDIPQDPLHPLYWYSAGHRATFEAGSSHDLNADSSIFQLGPNVENDVSAIIVEPVVDQSGLNRRVAYSFMGDYPADSGAPLINKEPQGLAHSDTDWFFTNTWAMFKVPLTGNVDSGEYTGFTCLANLGKGSIWTNTQIPQWLWNLCLTAVPPAGIGSCDHMGDPDQSQGYIFVPMEGCDGGVAKVAVYRAYDLAFVGADPLIGANAGWVAIDPLWPNNCGRDVKVS